MTVEFGFFDKLPDGVTLASYSEDQGSIVFGRATPDGLWPLDDSNGAATVAGDGSGVVIAAGTLGFARGFYFKVTADELVAVDAADASARIDRVTARLDKTANTFQPHYLKGTAGSVTPPALTRTDDVYDLRMWQVTRAVGGGLTLAEDRDWGALDVFATESTNQPPGDAGFALEYQTDTDKLIRRDGSGSRKTLLEDTGRVTVSPTGHWKVSTGFTNTAQRLNGWICLSLRLDRTGETLHTTDTNGSPLVAASALPGFARPDIARYGYANMGGGRSGLVQVTSAGAVNLFSLNADVPVGAGLRADIVYPGA